MPLRESARLTTRLGSRCAAGRLGAEVTRRHLSGAAVGELRGHHAGPGASRYRRHHAVHRAVQHAAEMTAAPLACGARKAAAAVVTCASSCRKRARLTYTVKTQSTLVSQAGHTRLAGIEPRAALSLQLPKSTCARARVHPPAPRRRHVSPRRCALRRAAGRQARKTHSKPAVGCVRLRTPVQRDLGAAAFYFSTAGQLQGCSSLWQGR